MILALFFLKMLRMRNWFTALKRTPIAAKICAGVGIYSVVHVGVTTFLGI